MNTLRQWTYLGLALFLMMAYASTRAAVITSGDLAIYDFDFTGATPPPPYDFMALTFTFGDFGAGESFVWQGFDGLNATGGPIFPALPELGGGAGAVTFAFALPGAIDGVFSIRVSDIIGSLDLSILATAESGDPTNPVKTPILNNAPTIIPNIVPEPETYALLLAGLCLLGFQCARRSPWNQVSMKAF